MAADSSLVVFDNEEDRNSLVLTFASPARNTETQVYPFRVQINLRAVEELHDKILSKLRTHRVAQVQPNFVVRFENDRARSLDSIEKLLRLDENVAQLTKVITARWSFVIDPSGDGDEHVHSILVRMSERPNPGMIFQRLTSGRSEDLDSLDGEAFAPVFCKIDFLEGQFGSELLALVESWVKALPRAAPTFGLIRWLRSRKEGITDYIYGTLPSLAVLASLGVWMAYLPQWMTSSIKVAVAWILLSAILFLLGRYIATHINNQFVRQLERICAVPVFQITAGDKNRMTEYLARSHKSMFSLAASGLVFGIFKGIGLYLAGVLIARLFV